MHTIASLVMQLLQLIIMMAVAAYGPPSPFLISPVQCVEEVGEPGGEANIRALLENNIQWNLWIIRTPLLIKEVSLF